jgi:hypothetical protein
MVSSLLKSARGRKLSKKQTEQAFVTPKSEKESEILCYSVQCAADIESDSSDDDFWGEADVLEKQHKFYVRKKGQKARKHPENKASNEDLLRYLEQLEKFCCESIEGTLRTFWMLFEDIVMGTGNNHYNAQNLSKSIVTNPSSSASRLATNNSSVVVGKPRRMSNEAKAAYLLQKLKETKPLTFSDKQSQRPSSGEKERPTLQQDDEVAPNVHSSTSGSDTMIPLKAERESSENRTKRKNIAKNVASTAKKGVKKPLKDRFDAIKSDLERQYAALKNCHTLGNGYEEFTDDCDENTLEAELEKQNQERHSDCKPTFMEKDATDDDDDTCSLEELGHFVEFRDSDLAFLENQLERQGSFGSVACCTVTKKRLQNIVDDENHRCLVEITPNVAMFVLPQRTLTG